MHLAIVACYHLQNGPRGRVAIDRGTVVELFWPNCFWLTRASFSEELQYWTMYINPPWRGFPSSIARQPRGCHYRTISLRKPLGEIFPTRFGTENCSNCEDIDYGRSAQEGVTYTVAYDGSPLDGVSFLFVVSKVGLLGDV